MRRRQLSILLANPRGFCAGVERAIETVERTLAKYGPPVYVHHDIVHNHTVLSDLRAKGAVFVEDIDAIPRGAPVVFSAHGVAKTVEHHAARRALIAVDATCPLVHKVHSEVRHHVASGRHVVLIGHRGHPEVVGTMGQVLPGTVTLVESAAQAEMLDPSAVRGPGGLAYATQTTLDVEETRRIVAVLRRRFPSILAPREQDICYATANRQDAVRAIAARCDAFVVVGGAHSSNSNRLVETARRNGCAVAFLLEHPAALPWRRIEGVRRLGVSAGASTPETLVGELIGTLGARYDVTVDEWTTAHEDIHFNLPKTICA